MECKVTDTHETKAFEKLVLEIVYTLQMKEF